MENTKRNPIEIIRDTEGRVSAVINQYGTTIISACYHGDTTQVKELKLYDGFATVQQQSDGTYSFRSRKGLRNFVVDQKSGRLTWLNEFQQFQYIDVSECGDQRTITKLPDGRSVIEPCHTCEVWNDLGSDTRRNNFVYRQL